MTSALQLAIEHLLPANGEDGAFSTHIPGLILMRTSGTELPRKSRLYQPSLCLVVQGAKEIAVGNRVIPYRENQALVVSLEVPAAGRVIEASPERPYLSLALELDVALITEMLGELHLQPSPPADLLGLFVAEIDATLADAFARLLRLADTPAALPVLGRQTLREVYYWLLTSANGAAIAGLTSPDGHAQRIGRAVQMLRDGFDKPIRIGSLAAAAGMSASSFYQHFKALTALTPLQYQKQLRLIEARRLMVADVTDVASAAYRVGYESPSQFSREYARLFGRPPRRHVSELRALAS